MGVFHRVLRALVGRDTTVIPAVCYTICNDVYIAAQQIGLSPTLCAANGSFITDYQACESCVIVNGNTTVIPEFEPFLDFCSAQVPLSEITVPPVTQSVVVATETVIPTPITSSANLAQSSSLASLLSQAKLSLLAEASSLGLDLGTTQRITSTVFYTPAATLYQNSSSTSTLAPTFSPQITKSMSRNHAWIAGAVIGRLFVVALGILVFWLWRRRKHQSVVVADSQQLEIKAQLHADSLPVQRHELEGHATTELGNERVPELPALEPVGSELSAKKQEQIQRKPVGSVT